MSSEVAETTKRKRETAEDEKPTEDTTSISNGEVNKKTEEKEDKAPTPKRSKECDSDDCISQEDLLAQLGLNSVKKLQTVEADPNRVIHPEPPKQSILELLKQPISRKILPSNANPNKEKPLTNGSFTEAAEDIENIVSKEKLILKLQTNLRNEEAKLLLLRKLYTCQNEKVQKEAAPAQVRIASVATATTTQSQSSTTASQKKTSIAASSHKQQQQQLLPQKKLPQKQTQNLAQKVQQKAQPKPSPSVLVQKPPKPAVPPHVVFFSPPRGVQPVIIAPKLVPVSNHEQKRDRQIKVQVGTAASSKVTSKSHQQSIPSPAVYASPKRPVQAVHVVNDKGGHPVENGLPKPKMRSTSTPEQSHAEAKIVLRKQLEKTLLEIPLPKPPVQDWNFVPSVNTQDFTILIGLEGVVNHILESQALATGPEPAKVLIPPKFCSQCDTDFTPGWRTKETKGASEGTLCESCYTQKIKKTLKTEHTTRLKDAFMKALKQEQEVEKKYQLSGVSVSSTGKTSAVVKPQTVRASSHQPIHPSATRIVYHNVHSGMQPQVFQPHHHSIVHQLQQQQLQQQHQELDRQEPARFFTYVGQPQPKQRHNYTNDNERQREYLLGMIKPERPPRTYQI